MDDLYSLDILSLSSSIAHLGALAAPGGTARRVSKLCGSWNEVDVELDEKEVTAFAIRLEACALGQASASILSRNIIGASKTQIADARAQLFAMLKEGAFVRAGRFGELAALRSVKDYPARHIAVLLPFDTALAAIENAAEPASG